MFVRSYKKGFTMIELMVVIAIIALLSSVIIASVAAARDRARLAAGKAFDGNLMRVLTPIGIWNFEEGSGTVVQDISGNGNTGTFSGGVSFSTDTPDPNSKFSLSLGTSQYVNTLKPVGENGGNFTIAHWVKTPNANGHANTVLNTGSGNGFRFGVGSSGKGLVILIGDASTFGNYDCGASQVVSDNRWHHVAGVFDRKNNKFSCYIDGRFIETISIGSFPNMSWASAKFGHYCCSPNFVGLIDDVRIYSQDLTLADIDQIYSDGKKRFLAKD